jgi:hypothetical protein
MSNVISLPTEKLLQACERLRRLPENSRSGDVEEVLVAIEAMVATLKVEVSKLSVSAFVFSGPNAAAVQEIHNGLVEDLVSQTLHLVSEIEGMIATRRDDSR